MVTLVQERYFNLLDAVEGIAPDEDSSDEGLDVARGKGGRQESSHGPLYWNDSCSHELQRLVDLFGIEAISDLDFSVTVADPAQPDCPLVACSAGFTELTGYSVKEIVGRNCRFLLNGVPEHLIEDETRIRCRTFCQAVASGTFYDGQREVLPQGLPSPWVDLPRGELICVQVNARKTGELFRNMFYLKQVELDDKAYILGLQAGLPDDIDEREADSMAQLERVCQAAFARLNHSMASIEQVLSSRFWYSAPMRRQD